MRRNILNPLLSFKRLDGLLKDFRVLDLETVDPFVKRILRVLVFSLLGLVLLFSAVFYFSPRVDYSNPQRLRLLGSKSFSTELWKSSGSEERGEMVHDFSVSRLSGGLTRAQALELLGPPTATYLDEANLAYRVGNPEVSSRFGNGFLFVLVPDPKTHVYSRFWIEPFPEDALKK